MRQRPRQAPGVNDLSQNLAAPVEDGDGNTLAAAGQQCVQGIFRHADDQDAAQTADGKPPTAVTVSSRALNLLYCDRTLSKIQEHSRSTDTSFSIALKKDGFSVLYKQNNFVIESFQINSVP